MKQERDSTLAEAMQRADWHRSAAIRLKNVGNPNASLHEQAAIDAEAQIAMQLAVDTPPIIGAGSEVVKVSEAFPTGHLVDTLANPTALSLEASVRRVELVKDAAVFETAVDAAEAMGAENSLEKMLAHQMALSHEKMFEFMNEATKARDPSEKARMANTAMRMMHAFQAGLLTMHRIRSGGRQIVTVQHVQVTDGGQAIVAGTVGTGGPGVAASGGREKK